MNWYHERNWRSLSGAAVIGLLVFGLSLKVAPAENGGSVLSAKDATSVDKSAGVASKPRFTHERQPLTAALQPDGAERKRFEDADAVKTVESRVHFVRVISSSPVSSAGGAAASRAAGNLGIGEACNCDEDCDPTLGGLADQCNIVQCIVVGICSGNNTITCSTSQAGGSADAICNAAGAGFCELFRQRCDVVQLNGFPCEAGNGFCILDVCRDDGSGTETSECVPQSSGAVINTDLSPCPKQCAGGAADGLRCDTSGQCPQGDCLIKGGGLCDNATDACYVGPSVANAIGRCCISGSCTETTQAACGGIWLRYDDPEQVEGDGNCICPKYGSGVAPSGADQGSIGPVRPSGLVCTGGTAATLPDLAPIYCEDDGSGFSPQFCLRRCTGGDNIGALCEVDNPDCGKLGVCSVGGTPCLVQLNGDDCGLCDVSGAGCDTGFFPCPLVETCLFEGGQTCPASNPGNCTDDPCATNTFEGGCEDGFLNIGDDYSLSNGSYLRLTQFRFRGGITNQGEDIIFEIWDSTGTILVDTMQVALQIGGEDVATENLPLTGTRDWTIEVDCWPTCNPGQLEVPRQSPVIIPPNGYVVMRSVRTIGTIDGATAFWSQTDAEDEGLNDNTKSWQNGDPNANVGTNVYIFELVGVKVPDPLGACCDQGGAVCNDTLRWECGQCTPDASPSCASTLLDCPDGGLTGSVCQFNKWFGPISHNDFEFGGADQQLCVGLSPCDKGGCCQGGLDGFCTVEEQAVCKGLGGEWIGSATDCDPDCCLKTPIGVDCVCETHVCVDNTNGFCSEGNVACAVANNGADCGFCDGAPTVGCSNVTACPGDAACLPSPGQTCPPFIPGFPCDPSAGVPPQNDCDFGQDCEFKCAPDPAKITLLGHPYECYDDIGTPLEPAIPCDPALNPASECPPIPCTADLDCPVGLSCGFAVPGFCDDTSAMTCEQSFKTEVVTTKTDFISSFFGVLDGDGCSLNTNSDRIGWYERFVLVDPTQGHCSGDGTTECRFDEECEDLALGTCDGADGADDCFRLTVSLCCTDPVLTPAWQFINRIDNCPCVGLDDVLGIPPDFDLGNNLKSGFGPGGNSNFPCEDENYAGTFTIPPGEYAYQIRAGRICVGTTPTQSCESDLDCEGTSCQLGTPDYTLHYSVESCQLAACCVSETCSVTNKLDCLAQGGNFLGEGDQPVTTCQADACILGSCCLDGACKDDVFHDTKTLCVGAGGEYFGGVNCQTGPCPACPFDSAQNCQQVQTIFGRIASMDRNPANGADEQTAAVLADDVKFGGSEVDTICWRSGFYVTPCCQRGSCVQNIDETWEVRIYERNDIIPGDCDAIPGAFLGMSTIQVLNKIEGTGQATGTWYYSGSLNTPIQLATANSTPGLAGDTYWMEVSGFGELDCVVFATHSRDHGNKHSAVSTWIAPEPAQHAYSTNSLDIVDWGLCEDSGLAAAPDVLGACCTCTAEGPGLCAENFTQTECTVDLRGAWVACADCSTPATTCPGRPDNDNADSPFLVSNLPFNEEGQDPLLELVIPGQNNICATDDGPNLAGGDGGCAGSIGGDAGLHDDIWYGYTAEACGDLRIHSCGDTDSMDQMIAIYDATAGLPLLTTNEIGCGDDTCGIGAGPSDVTVRVNQGTPYLIRVGGWNVEVPGGFFGSPRGRWGLHFSLEQNCAPVVPPILACNTNTGRGSRASGGCAPGEEPILKNRYISIDPLAGNPNPPSLEIRVTMTGSLINNVTGIGVDYYANEPDDNCASLLTRTRPGVINWGGCPTVHLTGCPMVPTSTYDIVLIDSDESESDPLSASTQLKPGAKWHGDVVGSFTGTVWTAPNGVVNITDAQAVIKTFIRADFAAHVSVTDVHPNLGGDHNNRLLNANDILVVILGFKTNEYPEPDLEGTCP